MSVKDLDVTLAPVVAEYGDALVNFVSATQLGQVAMGKLFAAGSVEVPARMVADSFNRVASAYVAKMEWTDKQLEDCEHAILLAVTLEEKRIIVPTQH